MKAFSTIQEAFDFWLENIYPSLPPDVKKGKLTTAWRNYKHHGSLSETRMREILIEQGTFKIKTTIVYEP
ncbi:hypothetical protein [Siphonobacter sp. SORGH_AS_1065]|uniref:hypothetical protein n=1 Tax=Siphonobacter sp. SORGH_AS_1065 TaxID=3041795 RepID=UPI00278B92B6|nr:hypothetical protein [Siphonobacter sp. SORGH_AS_1065]MDQ1087188.1 hypothetical protein [Siphonobacter sp. SORGH_AS_1065]